MVGIWEPNLDVLNADVPGSTFTMSDLYSESEKSGTVSNVKPIASNRDSADVMEAENLPESSVEKPPTTKRSDTRSFLLGGGGLVLLGAIALEWGSKLLADGLKRMLDDG